MTKKKRGGSRIPGYPPPYRHGPFADDDEIFAFIQDLHARKLLCDDGILSLSRAAADFEALQKRLFEADIDVNYFPVLPKWTPPER